MSKEKPLNYSFFKKTEVLLLAGAFMGLLQLTITVIYKERTAQLLETLSDIKLFSKKLLVDWLMVEAFAIVILFYLTFRLQAYISKTYPSNFKEVISVNLRYLFILLLSLCIFIPLAIIFRHVWRNEFVIDGSRLIRQFRHFGRMYGEALLPFLAVGYTFFNVNLYLQSGKKKIAQKENAPTSEEVNCLEVINDNGNMLIPLSNLLWIEKKDRIYEVKTIDNLYYIRKTLNELEEMLSSKGFIRINRGVLVNRTYVYNYSFWEYDKFILRMKDEALTEFIVSRERMRQIKSQLVQTV
ncbi:MAG: LytTR family DNA-binding domain-containing protein [Maribacter sp.]|uniref:LytTR family DNA-binding domain-containing protein n=1 Tax=Maribacter sp. TaxID=1897614 RepID=UPI003298F7A9